MKKGILFFCFIFLIGSGLMVAQESNSQFTVQWNKVESLIQKQLPESAMKKVDRILKAAEKEKNFQQVLKAYLYKMRLTQEKNPDEVVSLLENFEAFSGMYTKPEEKALLHSMEAELYAMYYNAQRYAINSRTPIQGYIPENINEWSKNLFFDKISGEISLSLSDADWLKKADVSSFGILIEEGKGVKEYQPTLYDFLCQRGITILDGLDNIALIKNPLMDSRCFAPVEDFIAYQPDSLYGQSKENLIIRLYQELLDFRSQEENIPALVYTDLQRLEYMDDNSELFNSGELYFAGLENLKGRFVGNEAVVPVLEKMAEYYLSQVYAEGEENGSYRKMAYDIAQEAINRFSKSPGVNALKNIQANIERKAVQVNYPSVVKPGADIIFKLSSQNIHDLEIKIYRVDATAKEYYHFSQNNRGYNRSSYPNRTLVETKNVKLRADENFGTVTSEVNIVADEYGIYEFTIKEKGNTVWTEQAHGVFTVSDFAFMQRQKSREETQIYVVDRVRGNTIPDVAVTVADRRWTGENYSLKNERKLKTDSAGLVVLSENKDYSFVCFFAKGKDCYLSFLADTYYYGVGNSKNDGSRLSLFTDRAIYRPGQSVYFKGIAYSSNRQTVLANTSYEVRLFDANGQEVAKKTLKTNDFGSISGEFILPENGLNGIYRLQAGSFSVTFSVEDYKRPTFEVTVQKPEKEVFFGQELCFKGNVKAYAGYDVANAEVKYSIVRRAHRLFWWYPVAERMVANGVGVTDANGNFIINFIPERVKENKSLLREQFYTYTLRADVTDLKGETQQAFQTVSVGDKSLFIIAEVPEMQDKQKMLDIPLYTETLNGNKTDSDIRYAVYQLESTGQFREKIDDLSLLKIQKKVLSGVYHTEKKNLQLDVKYLSSGYYKIEFSTLDNHSKEVKSESYVLLYSADDTRPPVKSYVWVEELNTEVCPGENAYIRFGTSAQNVSVLYQVMRGENILESKWIPFSDEIKTFDIPLEEFYGDGVNVFFTFVKNEELFSREVQVKRKTIDKKLKPSFSTFRDKLQPGEYTEWTVTIPEVTDGSRMAELMVCMYDASLDAIRPLNWYFDPSYQLSIPYSRGWSSGTLDHKYASGFMEMKMEKTGNISLSSLNWFGFHMPFYGFSRGSLRVFGNSLTKQQAPAMVESVAEDSSVSAPLYENFIKNELGTGSGILPEQIQVRTDFKETAFFYPQLRTDKEGNVKIAFTVPESLTRWNVKMLAHTPDLYYGQNDNQVVTQKELMVQLNMPRFVRSSDDIILMANVTNLTDNDLTVNVNLEITDPMTGKRIKLKDNKPKEVDLSGKSTKPVTWNLADFSDYSLLTVKVTAQAGTFTDGEQYYLPVLSDKVLLTESMPMTVRGDETRHFHFESLLEQGKNADSKSLTVEFAANPSWYALQALPVLSAPQNENAIDYLTAYYVNGLAAYIVNSNLKISQVFKQWKQAGGTRETLLSNLEKNAELKSMLLDETPWLMSAKDETEQKRRIALLFDINEQKNQGQQYLDKLIKLQKSTGAFSWFDGMSESRYITQQVLLEMAHFQKMTGEEEKYPDWILKALEYVDLQIARDFDELKKNKRDYADTMSIGDMQWFYLHTRSEYPDVPLLRSAKEAVDFYMKQAEKYWTQATLYGKAATALVCSRNGNRTLANQILDSLRETAVKSDEQGMYWAGNNAGYFWNERPVRVHTAIIEAFSEVSGNVSEIDEMKIWLLRQKQTQSWDSLVSTVDAIYVLLNKGTDWISDEGNVKIKLGNKVLDNKEKEAGTGFIKETFGTSEFHPKMGNVTIEKSGGGIGWGALYWQYYKDIDQVKNTGKDLSVTRKLFVEKIQDNKTTMIPVEKTTVNVGDKVIVRLVVTTDRNLEFVALKDLRAACFEPVNQLSGMVWREGVGYYQTMKDVSTSFFFDFLPAGTYVLEYEVWVNNAGDFADGMANVQCLYAPEFVSHSDGNRIIVK